MSYIHERGQELTGYQESCPWKPEIDLQCDFVMVYGIDDDMPARVAQFKEKGYVVHLMTGCSWGRYQDYLDGKWDGQNHWEESQTDREGNHVLHGKDVPYLVPTVTFSDYLTERLKIAVDAGVEAIHLEEPEFWDYSGYSEAFRREYMLCYREAWQPPHTSLDARYKASRLKAYLYARTLGRISAALKEYAMVKYGRLLRFYVPTHSLINYTQWKIMSPEAALIDIPTVDGYIAQIWTGTSRACNLYEGIARERTFETAFLEYGIMQELVKGTGRDMWFLHDPIEDWPEYTWEDYRKNYLKTAVASLLHPMIHTYEICPWPNRVFNGIYPRRAGLADGTIPTARMEEARPIPQSYSTLLSSMIQLFSDMDQTDFAFDGVNSGVGVLMSDTGLYQRSYPDSIMNEHHPEESAGTHNQLRSEGALNDRLNKLAVRLRGGEDVQEESRALAKAIAGDSSLLRDFNVSGLFPSFYGMTLPLLKYGLPVRPVQLDNVRRFPGYLDDYATLILSYEYMKPEAPDINNAFAVWVRRGGSLIYLGDGRDPYHGIRGWWNTGRADYRNPAEHLFELLELSRTPADGIYFVEKGRLAVWSIAPAALCLSREISEQYRSLVKKVLAQGGFCWEYGNQLTLRRGPYVISAVMDESIGGTNVFKGLFADMMENDYPIIHRKEIAPDGNGILFDFSKIEGESLRIIGCSARVFSLDCGEKGFTMEVRAADRIKAFLRIRMPKPALSVTAKDEAGVPVPIQFAWDGESRTHLIQYDSQGRAVTIQGRF